LIPNFFLVFTKLASNGGSGDKKKKKNLILNKKYLKTKMGLILVVLKAK
jgi:hypothetical protein